MKRLLAILFVLAVCLSGLSAQSEGWISMGYDHVYFDRAVSYEFGATSEYTEFAPGIGVSYFSFNANAPLGFFSHYSFLFPKTREFDSGAVIEVAGDGDMCFAVTSMMGFAYKADLFDPLSIYAGVGLNIMSELLFGDDMSTTMSIGAGADVGVSYGITNGLCINAGSILAWDFWAYGVDEGDRIDDFSQFSYRFYVALGLKTMGMMR